MSHHLRRNISIAALLLFVVGVGLFAYLGIYNRYWSDDWCINADFHELGFIDTLKGYTYITTYSSNRVSLIFFSGILEFMGVAGVQIMSPLGIALLVLGLYRCLVSIRKINNFSMPDAALAIAALLTIYYSIYLAPNLYQSLYWRSASLPYFSPIVMGTLVFALILHQGVREKPSTTVLFVVAILSFLAGGFSEAGCATLTTVFALYIGIAWLHRKQKWASQSLPFAITAFVSTLVSMVVLISSPTTTFRVGLYGEPASLVDLPGLILKYSFDFVKFSFLDLPLPHLVIAGLSFVLSYLLYTPGEYPMRSRTAVVLILVIGIFAFVLIASSFAPSAYIEKAPPHPRTRIIPRFVLTLALVSISWILGTLAGQSIKSKVVQGFAAIIFILFSLYSVRSIFIASQNIAIYSERAALWDDREAHIKSAIANGEKTIDVQAIDGLAVGGIRDFDVRGQGKPGYWINRCAARYYDVDAIDVISP